MKKFFTLLFFAGCIINTIAQTCNPLDAGFGSGGKAIGLHTNNWMESKNIIVQPDNKIIQVFNSGGQFGLIRYNSDGSLDNGFGTNGKVTTSVGNDGGFAQYGALQTDGKIVLAGFAYNSSDNYNTDIAVVRYNSNGSLDNSFGSGGKVVTVSIGYSEAGNGLSIQPDGKIVVASNSAGNNCIACDSWWGNNPFCMPAFTVLRFNSNGTLDNTFGQNGKSVIAMATPNGGLAKSILIQPDGKLVAAGDSAQFYCDDYYGGGSYSSGFMLTRFNGDGSMDNSFGENGMVKGNPGYSQTSAITLQTDGRIVVLGPGKQGGSIVARYNIDGSLDNSFGQNGKVLISNGGLNSLCLMPDGKIVLAGSSYANFLVCRLQSDGSFDNSFNNTGKLYFHPGNAGYTDYATGIALQGDNLIVGGRSYFYYQGESHDLLVTRLTNPVNGLLVSVTPTDPVYPCLGESVTLSINQPGTYQWYKNGAAISGATGSSLSITSNTAVNDAYFVKVTNGSECGQSDIVHVISNGLPVSIIPSGSLNICQGQTVNLESSESGTIQWFKDNNLIPGATSAVYTANASGSYRVFVKNSKGCGQSSVYVNVNSNKPVINWNGSTLTLNTSSGYYGYQWYLNNNAIAGANSNTIQPTQTGLYKVVISDYGCNTTSDEFNLDCSVVAVPKPAINWNGTQLFTAAGLIGYQWYFNGSAITGATSSSITPVQVGTYKVIVTGNVSCTNTSNDFNLDCNVWFPSKPVVDWNGSQFSTASGYAGYQWYKDDVAIAGATSNTFIPGTTQFGMYKVAVTDAHNCSKTSDAKPYNFTAVNDIVIGDATLRYYPNPASNTIYIDIPGLLNKKMTVVLYDVAGKKLTRQSLNRGQNLVPVQKLPSGLYQLEIQYGYERIALKVVVIK